MKGVVDMTTIRFKNRSGIKVDVKYDLDLVKIISTDSFRHYVYDQYCIWGVVGDDGLTYVERLEKKYEFKR